MLGADSISDQETNTQIRADMESAIRVDIESTPTINHSNKLHFRRHLCNLVITMHFPPFYLSS